MTRCHTNRFDISSIIFNFLSLIAMLIGICSGFVFVVLRHRLNHHQHQPNYTQQQQRSLKEIDITWLFSVCAYCAYCNRIFDVSTQCRTVYRLTFYNCFYIRFSQMMQKNEWTRLNGREEIINKKESKSNARLVLEANIWNLYGHSPCDGSPKKKNSKPPTTQQLNGEWKKNTHDQSSVVMLNQILILFGMEITLIQYLVGVYFVDFFLLSSTAQYNNSNHPACSSESHTAFICVFFRPFQAKNHQKKQKSITNANGIA